MVNQNDLDEKVEFLVPYRDNPENSIQIGNQRYLVTHKKKQELIGLNKRIDYLKKEVDRPKGLSRFVNAVLSGLVCSPLPGASYLTMGVLGSLTGLGLMLYHEYVQKIELKENQQEKQQLENLVKQK